MILLAWLKGIADSLESGSFKSTTDYPWPFFVGIVLVVGPPFAFVRIYLGAALLAVTGRWLGGSADARDCRAALAWSSVPQIAGLVLWACALAILGDELFYKDTPQIDASPYRLAVLVGLGLVCLVLGIWSLAVRWKCLGEAHGFSAWRGFLAETIVMSLFVALIAAVVIAVMAFDVFPSPPPKTLPAA